VRFEQEAAWGSSWQPGDNIVATGKHFLLKGLNPPIAEKIAQQRQNIRLTAATPVGRVYRIEADEIRQGAD